MITVVGLDGRALDEQARAALEAAPVVLGSPRQLDLAGRPARGKAVAGLPAELPDGAVVLASGDPGFFGVVRALAARGVALRVLPAVSSVALAFARLALPWDDAVVVSAHGRPLAPALAACRAYPKVAVLTGPGAGPAEIGAGLAGADRRLVVAARLGSPDEELTWCSPAQAAAGSWPDPTVVICLDPAAPGPSRGGSWPRPPRATGGWALPEEQFDHRDGMVTKAEVRAVALARLGPGPGELVWDVGAGSGAVAVECARFGAAVVAVDSDPAACALVEANAARHGVRLEVVTGTAPGALAGLPRPDAVHVGGAGAALPAVLAAAAAAGAARVVVPLAALERVPVAAEALRGHGYQVGGVLLSAARLSPLAGLTRLAPVNPTFLLTGVRP